MLRNTPVANNRMPKIIGSAGEEMRTYIMPAVANAENNIPGLRRLSSHRSESQPPIMLPMTAPIQGAAAITPEPMIENCLTVIRLGRDPGEQVVGDAELEGVADRASPD